MTGGQSQASLGDVDVPVLGSLASFPQAMRRAGADTVVVAHSPGINTAALQAIAWELEGTGVDLIVAPALTNVAGPRIAVRPVAGLPLLHIDEPELSGVNRAIKAVVDRLGALVLIAVLSPVMLLAAAATKLTSRGPLLFKQTRVGREGEEFLVLKFRSMRVGADQDHHSLAASHDRDGHVLFKMKNDPRVTPAGRVLRRYSIDELPQLFNVLAGHMSLVGPRPPLPSEVATYERLARRRLKVKPGVTGLWQVSGRADLPWDETVRLDLYYVENWSLALDVMILWKTAWAVIGGAGAY
jgi:exopolysaccharide biosynthesis polyprenyl glycosylphosphotransferase